MKHDKAIVIQNVYHMLAYAFQVLRQSHYENVAAERFENMEDMLADILARGIVQQRKQGLYRSYVDTQENLPILRGKLDMRGSITCRIRNKPLLACTFSQLSENNLFNQILKATLQSLVANRAVSPSYREKLRQLLPLFSSTDDIRPDTIPWTSLSFQSCNRSYQMLAYICRFILTGMLQTTRQGKYRLAHFTDEHMAHLYEKFILNYYKRHHPRLGAAPLHIKWNLDESTDVPSCDMLPAMRTDVTLQQGKRKLIIDAKYYAHSLSTYFGRKKFHSANLYQILAYVKNMDIEQSGNVSGMLLYARTNESITPDAELSIMGNRISVRTLNLNESFEHIRQQLDGIVASHFGICSD